MSRFFEFVLRAGLLCTVLAVAGGVQAGAISDISENTTTGGALFGPAEQQGDLAVDFSPTKFKSLSVGADSEIVDSQLSFVVSNPNIKGIWIHEGGDYQLIGGPGKQATASVSLAVFWEIVEINGQAVPGIDGQKTQTLGQFALPAAGGAMGGGWNGMMDIDVAGFLASKGVSGTATKIKFTLDNTLSTASVAGSSAFIAKKDVDITVHVPEPASVSLVGLGLAAMGLGFRRRS